MRLNFDGAEAPLFLRRKISLWQMTWTRRISRAINLDKARRAVNPANADRTSRNRVVSPGRASMAVSRASLVRIRRRRADRATRVTKSKTRTAVNVARPSQSFPQRTTWRSRLLVAGTFFCKCLTRTISRLQFRAIDLRHRSPRGPDKASGGLQFCALLTAQSR